MDIKLVQEVRDRSGTGLAQCKKALEESGNVPDALVLLQKWGVIKAAKASQNEVREGLLYSYVHHNSKIACLVEVNCQTDFCAKSTEFKEFCEVVALQIASTNPLYLDSTSIPEEDLSKQKDILQAQLNPKMPEDKKEIALTGKINRYFSDNCLMNQISVLNSEKTLDQLRIDLVVKVGENVIVKRFVRWDLGG